MTNMSSVFQISNRYKLMKSDIYAPRNREKGQADRKILITRAIISIVTLSCKVISQPTPASKRSVYFIYILRFLYCSNQNKKLFVIRATELLLKTILFRIGHFIHLFTWLSVSQLGIESKLTSIYKLR